MRIIRILVVAMAMFLILTLPVLAQSSTQTQSENTHGDISVMYFGAICDTGIAGAQPWLWRWNWNWNWGWNRNYIFPGVGSRSANGWYADGNLYFAKRWGLGVDYNSNNVNMGTFVYNGVPALDNFGNVVFVNNVPINISDFNLSSITTKVKYQLTDPENKDGALRVYLLWRNYNWSWMNAGYSPSGWGGGLDGYFKMGKNWEGYGMVDYASVNGNVLNIDLNMTAFKYEAGLKYYFGPNFFARAGYRGESFNFNRTGWGNGSLSGPIIGVGVSF